VHDQRLGGRPEADDAGYRQIDPGAAHGQIHAGGQRD
jgi:hypothetical protein